MPPRRSLSYGRYSTTSMVPRLLLSSRSFEGERVRTLSPLRGRPSTERLARWRSPRGGSARVGNGHVSSPLDLDFGREWLRRRDAKRAKKKIEKEKRAMAECVFSPVHRPGIKRSEKILGQTGLQYIGPVQGWKEHADKYAEKRNDDKQPRDCDFSPAISRYGDRRVGNASEASQRLYQDALAKQAFERQQLEERRRGHRSSSPTVKRSLRRRLERLYEDARSRRLRQQESEASVELQARSLSESGKLCPKSRKLAEARKKRISAQRRAQLARALTPPTRPAAKSTVEKKRQAAIEKMDAFLQRNELASVVKKERARRKLRLQELAELSECTFHPNLSTSRNFHCETDMPLKRALSSRSARGQSVHERLYETGMLYKIKREQVYDSARVAREREELSCCTFNPLISTHYHRMERWLDPGYDSDSTSVVSQTSFSSQNSMLALEDEVRTMVAEYLASRGRCSADFSPRASSSYDNEDLAGSRLGS